MGNSTLQCSGLPRHTGVLKSNDVSTSHRCVPSKARPEYSFELCDEAQWVEHLRERGFVVVRGVGNADQVNAAKDLLWNAVSNRFGHVVRNDPTTWGFPLHQSGIVPWLAQSAGAWEVRGWSGVKQVFARIWDTEDLIVSMDCVLLWR